MNSLNNRPEHNVRRLVHRAEVIDMEPITKPSAFDRQRAAHLQNKPIRDRIELAQKREIISARLLPELITQLVGQGVDHAALMHQVGAARDAIAEVLEDLHQERRQAVTELESQLTPE